jgi:hypothetical protein
MTTLIAATVLYAYFLGPWQIGPFTDLKGCQNARAYQVKMGGAGLEISRCKPVETEYRVAPPTYGAPLTPDEQGMK